MEEKRKYPRKDIDEPAFVSSGGSVMSCMVRNISPEGATSTTRHSFRSVSAW
jgi:hypothetical protein